MSYPARRPSGGLFSSHPCEETKAIGSRLKDCLARANPGQERPAPLRSESSSKPGSRVDADAVTPTEETPWAHIPAQDYESHMAEIGQSAALRDIFFRAYSESKPRRLLILGCATERDFEIVDPDLTEKSVGVDVNREYL